MKNKSVHWIALALLVVPMFASYFFDDMFSSVSQLFSAPENLQLGWNSADYGFYAGGYSFLCVWGGLVVCGMLLDKWGVRVTGSIFVGMMTAGAALVAVAISSGWAPKTSLAVAYVGCMLFGLGSEIAGVAVTRSIAKWFKGKNMAFAMGLQLAVARLGTAAALVIAPKLIMSSADPLHFYTLSETNRTALLGLALLLLGCILWAVFVAMDYRFDMAKAVSLSDGKDHEDSLCGSVPIDSKPVVGAAEKGDDERSESDSVKHESAGVESAKDESAGGESAKENDAFRFSDIFRILSNKRFLMIALLCVFFYCCIISFKKFATSILIPRFGIDYETASWMVSMIPFSTVVFAPLFGLLVDKVGKGPRWMIAGAALVLIAHLTIAFAPASISFGETTLNTGFLGYVAVGILGIGYSLLPAAMWPAVPEIVPEKNLGTAYSLIYWVQNIGLMTVPVAVGAIFKVQSGETAAVAAEAIFISLALLALTVAIAFAYRTSVKSE